MLASKKILGFVAVTDASRAREFYEKKLGLDFVREDPFALVLSSGGTMIRLQKVPKLSPQPFTVLGWEVEDVAHVASELRRRGIELERFEGMPQDDLGVWTAPEGAKVAWLKDPDGNLLSLSQH